MDRTVAQDAGGRIKRKCREYWPPISVSRLARRLDIDYASFYRILNGDRNAPEGMYQKVAEILGCDLADILSSEAAAA